MPCECRGPGPIQVPGEPPDPAQHLKRRHVEIGPLCVPLLDELVHLVRRLPSLTRSLRGLAGCLPSLAGCLPSLTRSLRGLAGCLRGLAGCLRGPACRPAGRSLLASRTPPFMPDIVSLDIER